MVLKDKATIIKIRLRSLFHATENAARNSSAYPESPSTTKLTNDHVEDHTMADTQQYKRPELPIPTFYNGKVINVLEFVVEEMAIDGE
ncbi:hypothetical protein N7507_003300 [Penicillium longicatenatum]|nr:hypothetical protein N7507_003300 [Penicillium longicatenatum]